MNVTRSRTVLELSITTVKSKADAFSLLTAGVRLESLEVLREIEKKMLYVTKNFITVASALTNILSLTMTVPMQKERALI